MQITMATGVLAIALRWLLVEGGKPNNLTMLSLMPISNNGMVSYPGCYAAMQAVIDEVNSRSDILPDYQILLQPEDEGPGANFAPRSFIRAINGYSNLQQAVSLSPIVLGPTLACQTVLLTLKAHGFLSFSELCGGSLLFARKALYSNLYRFLWPIDFTIPALVTFMQTVGAWNQIAVMTTTSNQNDMQSGFQLQRAASSQGIDVVHFGFDEGAMTEESLMTLKKSGARIIVASFTAIPICVNFLCRTYQYGMQAPQYFFLVQIGCTIPIESQSIVLPPGCTWKIVREQLKISVYYGAFRGTLQTSLNTSLGYDYRWFNAKMRKALPSVDTAPDQEMHTMCHDVAMAAVLVLNKSETILKTVYNTSLLSFNNTPGLVSTVVNSSAAEMDVVGLRVGRMKYSPIMELTNDKMAIAQTRQSDGRLDIIYNMIQDKNDYNVYKLVAEKTLTWMTKSGKPPKDLSSVTLVKDESSISLVGTMVALAIVVVISQISLAICGFLKSNKMKHHEGHQLLLGTYFVGWMKLGVLIGCLLLDTACIVFGLAGENFAFSLCYTKYVLIVFGITLINAIVGVLLFAYNLTENAAFNKRDISKRGSSINSKNTRSRSRYSLRSYTSSVKTVTTPGCADELTTESMRTPFLVYFGVITVLSIHLVVLFIWIFWLDPIKLQAIYSSVTYDETFDRYIRKESLWCVSGNQAYWVTALAIIQSLLLFFSCFFAFQLQPRVVAKQFVHEIKTLRMSAVNATSIYFGTLAITIIFALTGRSPWAIDAVMGLGCLVYSFSMSLILFIRLYLPSRQLMPHLVNES